jgi:hypothetical protein
MRHKRLMQPYLNTASLRLDSGKVFTGTHANNAAAALHHRGTDTPPNSTMGQLDSSPTEVIVRILESCEDFSQVLSLITTCKHLHSIWLTNPGTIIWKVGKRNILCFDDALMAVSGVFASNDLACNISCAYLFSSALALPIITHFQKLVCSLTNVFCRYVPLKLLRWPIKPENVLLIHFQ